jgi:hypothetical protein
MLKLLYFLCLVFSWSTSTHSAETSLMNIQEQLKARDKLIESLKTRIEALEENTPNSSRVSRSTHSSSPSVPLTPVDAEPAEEETTRALERALVREGGIVLPPKSYELEPRFTYSHVTSNQLGIDTLNGQAQLLRQDVKRDSINMGIGLRVGIPWGMQLEGYVPYGYTRTRSANVGFNDETQQDSGVGNVELGFTKQLLSDNGAVPALLGTVRWRDESRSNSSNSTVGVGSSFGGVQMALTFVKRLDPLVLVASISRDFVKGATVDSNRIEPGDNTGIRFSSIFAISPSISMRMGIDVVRGGRYKINDNNLPGSDTSAAMLDFGYSFLLSPRALLSVNAGIGLTEDSPDYTLGISLPIRFQF